MSEKLIFFDTWKNEYWTVLYQDKKFIEKKIFTNKKDFIKYCNLSDYLVAHNYYNFDINYVSELDISWKRIIDTLYLDSLFFIDEEVHSLPKTQQNNTLEDSISTFDVFKRNFNKFNSFPPNLSKILYNLLHDKIEYKAFFQLASNYVTFEIVTNETLCEMIYQIFRDVAFEWFIDNIPLFVREYKVELAFCIAFKEITNLSWKFPIWVEKKIPDTKIILETLYINKDSDQDCSKLAHKYLAKFFGYKEFRKTNWDSIQEKWVISALKWENIILWLPTWWWKSIVFQLPALIEWQLYWRLTVVIVPLKALMKDQVDSLINKWIYNVAYRNGELNSLEKEQISLMIKRWEINLLYTTPESLRTRNFRDMINLRSISRFVIDESHCLVNWWMDFRPDYFFVADFIKSLDQWHDNIAVSCFSATNSEDVLKWIASEFSDKLNKKFVIYKSTSKRKNLNYNVLKLDNENGKHEDLLKFLKSIDLENNPTVIFVRKTWNKKNNIDSNDFSFAENLSKYLNMNWISNDFFHGQMNKNKKKSVQYDFITWKLNLIIATKAFWMWIDKSNIRYVIHYNIPWSLEDYLQECGRAWRDWDNSICKTFYVNSDLWDNKKLQSYSKIQLYEISKVYKYIRKIDQWDCEILISFTKIAKILNLPIDKNNSESKIRIILMFLEKLWYIRRSFDKTIVFLNRNEIKERKIWYEKVDKLWLFDKTQKSIWKYIIDRLCNFRSIRIDQLADEYWVTVWYVEQVIKNMQNYNILPKLDNENNNDLKIEYDSWYWLKSKELIWVARLVVDKFFSSVIIDKKYKKNELIDFIKHNLKYDFVNILCNDFVNNLVLNKYMKFDWWYYYLSKDIEKSKNEFQKLLTISSLIIDYLYLNKWAYNKVDFSYKYFFEYLDSNGYKEINIETVKKSLLFMHKIWIVNVLNWLLVFYKRYLIIWISDKEQFDENDFKMIEQLYENKYFKLKVLEKYFEEWKYGWDDLFVEDYFNMDMKEFKSKYFLKW